MIGKVYLTLFIVIFATPSNALSRDILLADCDQPTVAIAINGAFDGDHIVCPAGSWTWTSPVIIDKKIHLRGATHDNTYITSANAIQVNSNKSFRISNFVFIKGSFTQTNGYINILSTGTGWRVHNNKFFNAYGRSINVKSSSYGLIDNNTFIVENGSGGWQQGITVLGGRFETRSEDFMKDLGTINAIYIENNVFNWMDRNDGAIDTGGAVRVVFRYNIVNGTHFNTHGTSTGYRVGPAFCEVYENTFSGKMQGSTGNAPMRVFNIRGGTGVIFNNTASGAYTLGASGLFGNDRTPGTSGTSSWGGDCDGTKWKVNNPTGDASLSITGDYMFCSVTKDKFCKIDNDCPNGETCSNYFDGDSIDGLYCHGQVGTGPNQTSEPYHIWNNIISDRGNISFPVNSGSFHIIEGRDFKYFPKPNYTPFSYPHPLSKVPKYPDNISIY